MLIKKLMGRVPFCHPEGRQAEGPPALVMKKSKDPSA
jgi:hypothetical protein